ENNYHQRERDHLAGAARTRLDRLVDGEVLSDCIINWNVRGLGNHSPGITVFERVRGLPLPRLGTYRGVRDAGRCVRGGEIVSPDTRSNDVDIKPEHYHRAGMQQFVIVDQRRLDGPREIINHRWARDGYIIEPPDANGRVLLEALGLTLELRDNRLVIRDAESGDEIGELDQEYTKRIEAEQEAQRAAAKAKREANKRQRAERRVQELEEELRRLRGE